MTTGKSIGLTRRTFVGKVMSLLFNMLSRLVIAFLPKSKHSLISWLQLPSVMILEPKKIKICHCFHHFPIYLLWHDGTGCHVYYEKFTISNNVRKLLNSHLICIFNINKIVLKVWPSLGVLQIVGFLSNETSSAVKRRTWDLVLCSNSAPLRFGLVSGDIVLKILVK